MTDFTISAPGESAQDGRDLRNPFEFVQILRFNDGAIAAEFRNRWNGTHERLNHAALETRIANLEADGIDASQERCGLYYMEKGT